MPFTAKYFLFLVNQWHMSYQLVSTVYTGFFDLFDITGTVNPSGEHEFTPSF